MAEENKNKKSHGFLTFIIVILILGGTIFGIIKFISCINSDTTSTSHTTSSSYNSGSGSGGSNNSTPKPFSRSANNGDIIISSDLDLSAFGGKYIITPQTDINGLVISITYLDKNKKQLTQFTKNIGNVKKGVQVNFSISLFDLGLSVAWNTSYESIAVIGGTVSYFT